MNRPNPAIVAQAAVRRFPRAALLLLCVAYVLSGFIGRDAWKSADVTALGYMAELANGTSQWLAPTLLGASTDNPALLPYWLGAWAIQVCPDWLSADFIVRIPFGILLTLALLATWYGTYYLARSPQAQPVAFAFGGEAHPTDYARTIADGGVLGFIACLGLAQLSHEATPALAQLAFSALTFYALSALPYHRISPAIAAVVGLTGLALSGAPAMAMLFGFGSALVHGLDHRNENTADRAVASTSTRSLEIFAIFAVSAAVALLSWKLGLWRWKIAIPNAIPAHGHGYILSLIHISEPTRPY